MLLILKMYPGLLVHFVFQLSGLWNINPPSCTPQPGFTLPYIVPDRGLKNVPVCQIRVKNTSHYTMQLHGYNFTFEATSFLATSKTVSQTHTHRTKKNARNFNKVKGKIIQKCKIKPKCNSREHLNA